MSEGIWVAIIGFLGTIVTVVSQNKRTRDELKSEMLVMKNEMEHFKQNMGEMKEDIKEHNHYAKMFSETMPVVQEQIKVANHRIDDLERGK